MLKKILNYEIILKIINLKLIYFKKKILFYKY